MSEFRSLRGLLAAGVSAATLVAVVTPVMAQTAVAQTTTAQTPTNVIEELVVTAQKKEEALQDVPIAVSAFDQGALEKAKIDGGANLVLAVPNVNFSKGNFNGYNFQIRGIGSKLVAPSGDAGTGIHLNNAPLIANNLFETEFYDMERVEVLRGPQGTLYGRNATGGVVNLITAKPTDQFEGNIRGEYGNYDSLKFRGMVNVPLGEKFAARLAGSYLKRGGFGTNLVTGHDADDRDLWGARATLAFTPNDKFRSWLLWDHFEEDDNRSRIGRSACTKDPGPANVGGSTYAANPLVAQIQRGLFSQGCTPSSLYDPSANGTVNSQGTLFGLLGALGGFQTGDAFAGKTQTPNIRDIEATFDPRYKSKTDTYELNAEFDVAENLRLTSLTAFTSYKLYSFADFTRYTPTSSFNTTPNPVNAFAAVPGYATSIYPTLFPGGVITDPQLGASNRFATADISSTDSDQWSQELRLQSSFSGPWNFNVGGMITKFKADSDYYVMLNTGTGYVQINNLLNTGNANCVGAAPCISVDPNSSPTRLGRNYYDNFATYHLTSYAAFGELYWQMTQAFKWTLGLRYSVDDKSVENHAVVLLQPGSGPGPTALLKAKFKKPTGRFGFDWKPDLGFTEETLVYAFYSRGYKAGGLNPPLNAGVGVQAYPATFKPELVNSYEIGTKNTLFGGTMQLNATAFHYDYKDYQVAKIINRTSVNENIDATVNGAEFEAIWQPVHGLRLNAALGRLDTKLANASSIDLFNRTQGDRSLILVKSSSASNCVVTTANAQAALAASNAANNPFALLGLCTLASAAGAGTNINGSGAIAVGTNPFGGLVSEGVPVKLQGKELPNSPHWTVSLGAQYAWTLGDWDATLRGDYYHQTQTFARIYNSDADRIKGWDNVNLTLTIENRDLGFEVAGFVKNATNEKAITDSYQGDDGTGQYRNTFYAEPRTYGVSVTKRW